MASGTIILNAKSVDGTTGACYTAATAGNFGRGAVDANVTFNYNVNASGLLTISYGSVSYPHGTWCVCSSNGYHLEVDFSTNGSAWSTIMSHHQNDWTSCGTCNNSSYNRVGVIAEALSAGLTPVVLPQSGYIRIRMWTQNACPTADFPNAFPNDAASTVTAVPVHIDVDYRPGEVRINGVWKSTNRSGGKCQIVRNGTWTDMKTTDGGTGTGNPPSRRINGAWKNQSLIGSQS